MSILKSATRRIRASCLGICFIPQVVNFAQTALSRCSILDIDRNAQAYLAVSVGPSRKESPMQVKTAIIATAGTG
jgi:hypothetical protein